MVFIQYKSAHALGGKEYITPRVKQKTETSSVFFVYSVVIPSK